MRRISKAIVRLLIVASVVASVAHAAPPFIWEADTTLGDITDKARIASYLDDLKAHSVNGLWVQVESYTDGSVNYKKTTVSGLPTAQKFKTGQWADDDFLSYVIAQAKSRGMQVMIKFHGSNDAAWDKNPGWRKRNSKGQEVLWEGRLKNFCVNSPYWDKVFFPMIKEIGAGYDVDGFYLDTCQVAYNTDDACFCPQCAARFEKETGKKLPAKSVDKANWTDPVVKLHAIKRVEWLNEFYEKFGRAVQEAKPGAAAVLNQSGMYNSYKDGVYARHAATHVTHLTPEPVNTPRMWAVTRNRQLKSEGKPTVDERTLARDEIVPSLNRYGYYEFMLKTMLADGAGKPVIPFTRYWFTDESAGYMGPVDLEIAQIETAIGAGAKGVNFFGYLAHAMATNKVAGTAWTDPKFIAYLKDLTSGPRAQWIADMQPDSKVAILYDRDADFWSGDYWNRLKSVGALYAALQYWRKTPVSLIATSEPDAPGFGPTGYKLDPSILTRFDIVIAPGLDYVSERDLQILKEYTDKGGRLVILGPVGGHGNFLAEPLTQKAYELLGIATEGEAEPSGFLIQAANHPVFTVPGGFTGALKNPPRLSADKNDALSYKPKFAQGWDVLAYEVNDSGRRASILMKEGPTTGIGYINSDMVAGFTPEMLRVLANMIVVATGRSNSIMPVGLSPTASVNSFRSADGLTRYLHIFTLDGEGDVQFRIRAEKGTYPISVEVINGGGNPIPVPILQENREPAPWEMTVTATGNGILRLKDLKSPFAMVKIRYERREQPQ